MNIAHIDDIRPAIEGRPEFIVIDKVDYQVIDYVYQERGSFDDPRRLECRGVKFDRDGLVLARPFHKFFNVGEKEKPEDVDLTQPHILMDKLDGSMVHAAILNGQIVFMTRKGVTDVAEKAADRFLTRPDYFTFISYWLNRGFTPIFEFTAPDNRIVVRYDDSALTLLAVRDNVVGDYVSYDLLEDMAAESGIPLVGSPDFSTGDAGIDDLLEHVRGLEDEEGYVIRFEDGHMLKMKAEAYVLKHRALDDLNSKRKVLALVLQGFEDDVIPSLDDADKFELQNFSIQVNVQVIQHAREITEAVKMFGHLQRKDFALEIAPRYPDWMRGALFKHLDGHDPLPVIRQAMQRNPDVCNAEWRGE